MKKMNNFALFYYLIAWFIMMEKSESVQRICNNEVL